MRCGGGQSGVRRKDSYLGSFKRLVLLRHLLLDGQVLLLLQPLPRPIRMKMMLRLVAARGCALVPPRDLLLRPRCDFCRARRAESGRVDTLQRAGGRAGESASANPLLRA